jgi:hypothetical protein
MGLLVMLSLTEILDYLAGWFVAAGVAHSRPHRLRLVRAFEHRSRFGHVDFLRRRAPAGSRFLVPQQLLPGLIPFR